MSARLVRGRRRGRTFGSRTSPSLAGSSSGIAHRNGSAAFAAKRSPDSGALEPELLRRYHAGLEAGGVRDYAFEQCLRDYRLALAQRFGSLISSIVVLPFTEAQKQTIIDVQLPRNVAALEDHDVPGLLAAGI